MSPTVERTPPPYRQVADHIRRQINDGRLKPGDQVPTVRQIVEDFKVASATAHRALKALASEGYIYSVPGPTGSRVTSAEQRSRGAAEHADRSARTGRVYPQGLRAHIVETGVTEASQQVADALGVGVGSRVVYRTRVTLDEDNRPISTSTSWFPGGLANQAPRLLDRERIAGGTFAYIADVMGQRVTGGEDQVWAEAATREIADRLEVAAGTPVLAGRNWFVTEAGDVVEYGESWSKGRRSARWSSAEPMGR